MYLPQLPTINGGENIFTAVKPSFHRMSSRQRKSRNKPENGGVKKRVSAVKITKQAEAIALEKATDFLANMDKVCSTEHGAKLGTINLGEKSHDQYGYHLEGILLIKSDKTILYIERRLRITSDLNGWCTNRVPINGRCDNI